MIGSQLAHYTVTAHLGAGGMGEVWRARDSKLGRDVALKLLPPVFAHDAERLARFQREAKLLAALNHPHIGSIYGLEETDGAHFLVLELVEGPTLADRAAHGPIPVAEALPIALQIAEAIETAHEKGVIHRDLKPANVKLTTDGRVKVLDFGLAKAFVDDPSSPDAKAPSLSQSPTIPPALGASLTSPAISGAMTDANVILGTAAYMAPEQARGQPVDRRADIWAFGVILFEMLTGRRLFAGETVSDTLAAVLKTDPDWAALPEDTPPRIRRLLRRCLERNPRERLRDAGDARLLLREAIAGAPEETPAIAAAPAAAAPRRPWLLPAVAAVAAAIAAAATWGLRPTAPEPPLRRFLLPVPSGATAEQLALAPDGSAIALVRDGRLEVRELRTAETRTLAGTEGALAPFWSPDGEWIAYGTQTEMRKVRRTGGESVLIAALQQAQRFTTVAGGSWAADGRITFTSGSGGVWTVSAQGGDPELLASVAEGETDFHELGTLPDGRGWLVVVHGSKGFDTIARIDARGGRTDVLTLPEQSLYDVEWVPSGHLVFRRSGSAEGAWALPFSARSGKATGEPFLAAPDARWPTLSADGTLAYVRGAASRLSTLTFFDREGNLVRTVGAPGAYYHFPALSPDGRQVACRMTEGDTRNLWLIDVERGSRRRFTSEPDRQDVAAWDATGKEFWYYTGDGLRGPILVRSASGAGEVREVTQGVLPVPTADGSRLFFSRIKDGVFDFDLWTLDLAQPDAEPVPFVATDHMELTCMPSPTDRLLAYDSDASGRTEVYLATYPEITGTWLVSTTGGAWPRWRADGRELYYAIGDSILAVDVEPGDGTDVRLGRPRLLFRRPDYTPSLPNAAVPDGFAVTPDGTEFLVHVPERDEDAEPPAIVLVQSWATEFRTARR